MRKATAEDIPAIVEMGAKFHEVAGWGDIAVYDRDDIAITLANMIENEAMILLVAEAGGKIVGMAGGMMSPLYFNHAHRIGQELFYWIEPGARNGIGKDLLDALETEARAGGCASWVMMSLDSVRPEATGRLYQMRGYKPAERTWVRRL